MFLKKAYIVLQVLIAGISAAQISTSGCYISGAMLSPTSVAGCGNGSNYCDLASVYVPAFSPSACAAVTTTGGVNHTKLTAYTLPAGCTATIEAEYKKRNYFGSPVNPSGVGCTNSGMDASGPDALKITQSGGVITSQSSIMVVNVATCAAYPALGTYTTATANLSSGCSNSDGYVTMILTGGSFTVGGASDRADELITFTVNFSGTCGPSCSGVLPIELTDFYGEANNKSVHLYWRVASERNTSHYIIEKSLDMHQWREMGKLESSKTNISNITYQIADNSPVQGFNYYRLTDYNTDGSYTKHKAIAVNYMNKVSYISYTQNEEELIINYSPSLTGFNLNVCDVSGRLIKKIHLAGEKSAQKKILKTEIPLGVLLINCDEQKQLGMSKIIVY